MHYVYILASKRNGTLYVGSSNELEGRVRAHKKELLGGFTKKYNVKILVHYESYPTIEEAAIREKRLKHWKRAWKIKLIEENNPTWKDLSEGWFN